MVLLMAVSLHFYANQIPSGASVKILLKRAAIFILAAFIIWNIDNLMCEKLRKLRSDYLPSFMGPLFQFHAWWHVLTMISGTHSMVAVTMARCKTHAEHLERNEILWKLEGHYFNGMVPWIHFKRDKIGIVEKKRK